MPTEITLVLSDESIAKLASAILGGTAPAINSKVDPPAAAAGKKGAAKKEEKAPAAEAPPAEPAADEAPTTDLVTEKQQAAAKDTADQTGLDDIRAQLTDFYVGQGSDKKEIQNAISSMSEDDLRAAYLDYLARLVIDETGDFTGDFDTPYLAARVNDGKETLFWVKGGVTMTDEEVKAAKLADPNAKAAAPKKGPALPSRKK